MSRTDQFAIVVHGEKDGKDYGIWKGWSGGGSDSNEAFVRDQYGQPRRAIGGPRTIDTISVTRSFYADTDNGQLQELERGAGRQRLVASLVALDADGNVVQTIWTRPGMNKSCKLSDVLVGDDSPSQSDYTLEISPDGA